MAAKTEMIHARVEPKLKRNVEKIFDKLGITATEAIRMFYRQVELRKGLPFAVRIPNAVTAETLRKSAAGEDVYEAEDMDDLFKKLGI
jgi:DNA-damage-inducible protein J